MKILMMLMMLMILMMLMMLMMLLLLMMMMMIAVVVENMMPKRLLLRGIRRMRLVICLPSKLSMSIRTRTNFIRR
jgi:hypothetical protein